MNELKFGRFHEILNQIDTENFSFPQTKKKILYVPCTTDNSSFSQQMPYCLATLLVYTALTVATTHNVLANDSFQRMVTTQKLRISALLSEKFESMGLLQNKVQVFEEV